MVYIACKYDDKWWIEMISEMDQKNNDLQLIWSIKILLLAKKG